MTDKVQAKKDLEFCSAELSKYQNLSRSGLTRDEMLAIDGIMIKLKPVSYTHLTLPTNREV